MKTCASSEKTTCASSEKTCSSERGKEICFRNVRGYYNTKVLMTLARLGFFNSINADEVVDVNVVSQKLNISNEFLLSILNYLVITGFFVKQSENCFILSDMGKDFIPYYGYLYMMVGAYEPVFNNLVDVLKGDLVYGENIFRDGKDVVLGMNYIENFFFNSLRNVMSELNFSKILDIGCGNANVLSEICKLRTNITGIGIDINESACIEAQKKIDSENLNKRVSIVKIDAADIDLNDSFFNGVDLILAMFLMHEILKQRSRKGTVDYLKKIASILDDNGQFLMIEVSKNTIFEHKENLLFIPEYELTHDFSNQQLATKAEWEEMLSEAGLMIVDTKPIGICQAFGFITKKVSG